MTSEEYRDAAPKIAFELGAAAALVKFASEYDAETQRALVARLLPDHHELLGHFKRAGAVIAGK